MTQKPSPKARSYFAPAHLLRPRMPAMRYVRLLTSARTELDIARGPPSWLARLGSEVEQVCRVE